MKQLILRTCKEDLTSYNRFQWKLGKNTAPDWNPKPKCGNGLHGLLWGEGDATLLNYSTISKWLIAEIDQYIDLHGKVKFQECNVIFIGTREQTTQFLYQNSNDKAISGLIMKGNNLKGGYGSRLTGEDGSKITAKSNSTITAGNYCTIIAEYSSSITTGNNCSITVKAGSSITTGNDCSITTGTHCRIIYNNKTLNVNNGNYYCKNGEIINETTYFTYL